ncbi:AAL096Wp [Eremothecium gossypii ATCC 10895]|uniref:Sulfurtransferase n=1 Tax=Eremothecium gossypii (strain ATCC 10895 / CBS 109.51 / FGSC 9923 / NRRL Y-1056) TaxID=284811 RepID=Q75F24_EREGS|nr:AAL096Wp [Eremothecium gossypii ATCC 10895]AAS50270.1 AAL096Wp [Eremothecium gossypii ATCC 10895]AEY94555.1 FAAL096Wp [Eremothecium gossypii FDAG1]
MSLYSLITPKAFSELLHRNTGKRIVPVDATWYMADKERDLAKKEFMELERIHNAIFFDIDVFMDQKSPYPHMLPSLETFNEEMGKLGIREDDILVVYDRCSNFSASRAAWELTTLGHETVFLLTGLNAYKEEGYPLDITQVDSVTPYEPTSYTSCTSHAKEQVITYEELHHLVETGEIKHYNFFDMRTLPRFLGEAPDPRPGVPSGHVPGAQPMPYAEVLEGGNYSNTVEGIQSRIAASLSEHGTRLDCSKHSIVMCGSGVTACTVKTAFEACGYVPVRLYDGSWSEWGRRAEPRYIAIGRDW